MSSYLCIFVCTMADDICNLAQCLNVIDQCWSTMQTFLCRIRRTQVGEAATTLQRCNERRLLATDKGTGPLEHTDIKLEIRAKDIFS